MGLDILLIALIVGLDQLVKYFTVLKLQPIGTYPLIQDVLHLTYVENTGAAFSVLEGQRWLFILLTVVVVIAAFYALNRWNKLHPLFTASLIMICGGAIGNAVDRMRLGYVVDMIDFRLIHFAVFNVADCFVVVGSILLAIYILLIDKELFAGKEKKA